MFDLNTKILIADDMDTVRLLISKYCKEMGFKNVLQAKNGDSAWQMLQKDPEIGLVITDWNMPNGDGLELLQKVRADQRYQKLPFMIVTAETAKDKVLEALKAGVGLYIVKPFTNQVFTQKLEQLHRKVAA